MKSNILILLLLLWITPCRVFAQQAVTVSGFVKDSATGEMLIGATVADLGSTNGVYSDNNGFFSIRVSNGTILSFLFVGYEKQEIEVLATTDTLITVDLVSDISILEEIVVSASRKDNNVNVASLSTRELVQIPAIGGKPDVSKGLQLLPGIVAQNEGSALLVVRGGDPGQNLYLFDNVPIIHVNHLGGFISVFNPEIINNISLYKGGFPAKYGGKLSSIVDITQREGDVSSMKGTFSIGLTDMSFSVEGPTKLENSSYIVTGRKTMIDALMAEGTYAFSDYTFFYGFHDVNGKFTWKPDKKNTLNLNFYYGDDYLVTSQSSDESGETTKFRKPYIWGNIMGSAQLKKVITPKLYLSQGLSYTKYRLKDVVKYGIESNDGTIKRSHSNLSSVQNMMYSNSLKYSPLANITVEGGTQLSFISYLPDYEEVNKIPLKKERTSSSENVLYLESTVSFLKYSKLVVGLRGVGYFVKGYNEFSLNRA